MKACVLILAMVCHPAQHKAQLALTVAQSALMAWDGIETRRLVKSGYRETDPLAIAVVGYRPTWRGMAPAGAALVIGTATIGDRLRQSRSPLRKIWWIPQALTIAGNSTGVAINVRLR